MKSVIYIEDEWSKFGDADDIIQYYSTPENKLKYDIKILSRKQLENIPSWQILRGIIFANTQIIQEHIKSLAQPQIIPKLIPDTYDREFIRFFGREIEIITLDTLRDKYLALDKARFIKPLGNSKSFNGQVIYDYDCLNQLLFENPKLTPTTRIYSASVIDIQSELRLLIGQGRLYGCGQISIADPPNRDYLLPIFKKGVSSHGQSFLDKLILASGNRFLCVDIGWIPDLNRWVVIEINPAFSIDNYNILLADYLAFTEDAFRWIQTILN
jgi:hypothetical protein